MKKIIFLVFVLVSFFSEIHAQVTIGSGEPPHKDALLDLKESVDGTSRKGFLLPRVSLKATNTPAPMSSHVTGMTVYNTTPSDTSDPEYQSEYHVSKGFYYNDGAQWVKLHLGAANWFYMPSISIPTGATTPEGTTEEINLYAEYKKQFDGSQTTYKASTGAPAVIPYIPQPDDLYYYLTYYSPDVFEISEITADGKMKYKVIGAATDCSYINVVFVMK